MRMSMCAKAFSNKLFNKTVNRADWSPKYLQEWKLRKLFPERPEIPGRRAKLIFGVAVCGTLFAYLYSLIQSNKRAFLEMQSQNIYERIRPFIQAMDDVKMYAVDKKQALTNRAIMEQDHPGAYDFWTKKYIQDITIYAYQFADTHFGKGFHTYGTRFHTSMLQKLDDAGVWGRDEKPFA